MDEVHSGSGAVSVSVSATGAAGVVAPVVASVSGASDTSGGVGIFRVGPAVGGGGPSTSTSHATV